MREFFDEMWALPEADLHSVRSPLVNVEDKGDKLMVTAELPGMKKEDIQVDLEEGALTISAERKGVEEEKEKDYYRCERQYSSFRRRIALPEQVNLEGADAEYSDGILTISLPKKEGAESKKKGLTIR